MKNILIAILCLFSQYSFCQEQEEVWTLIQQGEDIYNGQIEYYNWPYRWDIESLDMHQVEEGFLTCGYYNDLTLDSRDGNSYDLTDKYGAYLAKYDLNGNIQWVVRTEKAENEERNVIMSIDTDSQGNIFIVGHSDGNIYDTTGIPQAISPQLEYPAPFVIKLTPDGEIIWKMVTTGMCPKRVAIDGNDNIIVGGMFPYTNSGSTYINDTYINTFSDISGDDANYYIAKFSPTGQQLWDAGINIYAVNRESVENFTFDADNNIYVHGGNEINLKIYDADEDDYLEKGWNGTYGGSMYIAKFTPEGDAQWLVTSENASVGSIVTMPDGNNYVCGSKNFGNGVHVLTNADDSEITQNEHAGFYLAKLSPTGYWQWITGSTVVQHGYIHEMIKHGNSLSIIGSFWEYDTPTATAIINGNNGYANLSLNISDLFIASYDLEGNLLHLSKSGDNEPGNLMQNYTSGYFMDSEGYGYLQRNLWYYNQGGPIDFYGQSIGPTLGPDAVITKFKPKTSEQIILNTEEIKPASASLSPNPTNGLFTITLNGIYPEVKLKVTDISGKLVMERTYGNSDEILAEIDGADGIYFASLETAGAKQWFKIIKAN
ncbi:T9SS type A sorting domain-containing protein [Flavobacterium sp. MFBS3-15]|uniref:T9SS type A sorting domain-containing protein n=1 Tax=Flavobacterium sp. MFBS3-15 TaxID=2989816 RepID=UPI0022355632|nr:T9SS type A sorting domain-containing protein [Flavobacterium sp. MFBS3-15]MCW4467378.1 T9SS type A sorting domain-containing protein [Flavobacterium sp. MFBS3-15]